MKTLKLEDFAKLFGISPDAMPKECRQAISDLDFRYTILEGLDREATFLRVLKTLDSDLEVAGRHRQNRWKEGWAENLREFVASEYDLMALGPKFVRRKEVIRLAGNYILPADPNFETNFVTVLRLWLFKTWFAEVDHVYEFGCGTAHNLVALAKLFPHKMLHGLDWATESQQIIALLVQQYDFNITGHLFNMFEPDPSFEIAPNSGVFTVGTMEQLGHEYEPFLQFLLRQPPRICINVEILYELHDEDNLFDYVAARYLRKRGYLEGYLPRLRELEAAGQIQILQVQRVFGGLYHEGYTVLVWKPVCELR